MQITGTHFNYYIVCPRKLWLFANGITMEHTSDLVHQGNIIHEHSYAQRALRYQEIELGGIKIDFYDPQAHVIHEIKKSRKEHNSHLWQLKYYLYILHLAGIEDASGILEYPKERKTEEVYLSTPDVERIKEIELQIPSIVVGECPKVIIQGKCAKCAYNDFCYASEE